MTRAFTDAEKLEVLDQILERCRDCDVITAPKGIEVGILKAIHAEIRARSARARSRSLDALSFQVNSAARAKARVGFLEVGYQQALAEALMAHWPAVRAALEEPQQEKIG